MCSTVPISFIDETKIPKGMYCYTFLEWKNDKGYMKIAPCPYWRVSNLHHEQESGYCIAFNMKDWEDGGILWDQVKECDVNYDIGPEFY